MEAVDAILENLAMPSGGIALHMALPDPSEGQHTEEAMTGHIPIIKRLIAAGADLCTATAEQIGRL